MTTLKAAPPAVWSRWFVFMWGAIAAVLIVSAFLLPFRWWAAVAAVGFGVPEWIGVRKHDDRFPPLTSVIRRYVPRWFAIPVMSGLIGACAAVWFGFPRPAALGAVLVLYAWILVHFDVTYDD